MASSGDSPLSTRSSSSRHGASPRSANGTVECPPMTRRAPSSTDRRVSSFIFAKPAAITFIISGVVPGGAPVWPKPLLRGDGLVAPTPLRGKRGPVPPKPLREEGGLVAPNPPGEGGRRSNTAAVG